MSLDFVLTIRSSRLELLDEKIQASFDLVRWREFARISLGVMFPMSVSALDTESMVLWSRVVMISKSKIKYSVEISSIRLEEVVGG